MLQTKLNILKYLKQTLDASNCLIYRKLGQIYCDAGLVEACNWFFCRNFQEVSNSPYFNQELSIEDLEELLESHDQSKVITVSSEDNVAFALLNWVLHDKGTRMQHLRNLQKLVNWTQITQQCIEEFGPTFSIIKGISKGTLQSNKSYVIISF